MNSTVVRNRITEVVKPDSITYSQGDFLATHVSLKRLHLLDSFQMVPTDERDYTEEDVYQNYVLNPDDKHQLIAVYGQSGTGKSHLIRWLEARFEQDKPDDEVILFIKRSDNTLKGTIKQLLEKKEVQNIPSREIYNRLLQATTSIEENKLKDMLYSNFGVEVRNDTKDREVELSAVKRKRLSAFLDNDVVRDHMLRAGGPVERLYSKIAEQTKVDRDRIAQFEPKYFIITSELYDAIYANADSNARKMALELMADETGRELAELLANYLNQFVNDVIQRCAGIEPGDFRQVFLEIRKELNRQGKSLTLFIEDVTSFTGVDEALLDSLIVEHTGLQEEEALCRISSIVGTTNNYLQNNFRDNHKDRITKYVYIPSDVFDSQGLYEFVGKYINTMSLESSVIDDWLSNHAENIDYPIHVVKEGEHWDTVEIDYGKELNLYPFTKNSINYFYKYRLEQGHQTPRYIIKNIIEPVVRDVLDNKDSFPDEKYRVQMLDSSLNLMVHSNVEDQKLAGRLFRFLSIWGDGSHEEYTDQNGDRYICSIREDIIRDLGFPAITLAVADSPKPKSKPEEKQGGTAIIDEQEPQNEAEVPKEKQAKVASLNAFLTQWGDNKTIDIVSNVKDSSAAKNAISDLSSFIYTAINWQSEGISLDEVQKVNIKGRRMFYLEGQTRAVESEYIYSLSATWDSIQLLLSFARWREFGGRTWDYKDAPLDLQFVIDWLEGHKKEIINAIKEDINKNKISYIDAAIASELYRKLLCGDNSFNSLKEVTVESLSNGITPLREQSGHSAEWKSLERMIGIGNRADNNHTTVQNYFNIIQGDGTSTLTVYDELAFNRAIKRVVDNNLTFNISNALDNEPIKARKDIFETLAIIYDRIEKVVLKEKELAETNLKVIMSYLGDDVIEEEDILDLVSVATKFYDKVNEVQFNIRKPELVTVEQNVKHITLAINAMKRAVDEEDTVSLLLLFTKDPLLKIKPLVMLLKLLGEHVEKVNKDLAQRMDQVEEGTVVVESGFIEAAQELDQDIAYLKEVETYGH